MADTRARILDAALELFAERGYAGTSVADLAKQLGITKAALYYHFSAKSDILEALVSAPLASFEALAATARSRSPEELLGDISDVTVEVYSVSRLIGDDPSVRTTLRVARTQGINEELTAALAESGPTVRGPTVRGPTVRGPTVRGPTVRAHAAYAAIKNGTLAVMASTGARPTPAERAELIAAAMRALG